VGYPRVSKADMNNRKSKLTFCIGNSWLFFTISEFIKSASYFISSPGRAVNLPLKRQRMYVSIRVSRQQKKKEEKKMFTWLVYIALSCNVVATTSAIARTTGVRGLVFSLPSRTNFNESSYVCRDLWPCA